MERVKASEARRTRFRLLDEVAAEAEVIFQRRDHRSPWSP